MKLKFTKNELHKFITNPKQIYPFIIAVILLQFIFITIILLQNCRNTHNIKRIDSKVITLEDNQRQITEKMNLLQANVMKISAQIYRLGEQKGNN